ncbi:hypothetical protein GCM10027416_19590 [Okibacterium endophyticum]
MVVNTMSPGQFRTIFRDYRDSWTSLVGQPAKRARRRAVIYYYGLPSTVAAALLFWHIELTSVTPYLTAMSVFTALLFGLLFLVFNLAVTLRKDGGAIGNAHGLGTVISDLRATISYTIVVAVALVVLLAVATGFMAPDVSVTPTISTPTPTTAPAPAATAGDSVLHWGWTPALAWLALHLVLNVLKILERFRTAFNLISR